MTGKAWEAAGVQRKQFLICSPNKEEEFECLYVKENCLNENKTTTVHSHILLLVLFFVTYCWVMASKEITSVFRNLKFWPHLFFWHRSSSVLNNCIVVFLNTLFFIKCISAAPFNIVFGVAWCHSVIVKPVSTVSDTRWHLVMHSKIILFCFLASLCLHFIRDALQLCGFFCLFVCFCGWKRETFSWLGSLVSGMFVMPKQNVCFVRCETLHRR